VNIAPKTLETLSLLPAETLPEVTSVDLRRHLINSSHNFEGDFAYFVDAIPVLTSASPHPKKNTISAMKSVAYRIAEVFESYERIITALPVVRSRNLKSDFDDYKTTYKRHSKPWKLLCNKLKHNGNRMVIVSGQYAAGSFCNGFALHRMVGVDSWEVNTDFHLKRERCMSFWRAAYNVLYDLSKVDEALSKLLRKVGPELSNQQHSSPRRTDAIPSQSLIAELRTKQSSIFPNENTKYWSPCFTEGGIKWTRKNATILHQSANLYTRFTADGLSRTFPLPY
jgi:hypothetical protein